MWTQKYRWMTLFFSSFWENNFLRSIHRLWLSFVRLTTPSMIVICQVPAPAPLLRHPGPAAQLQEPGEDWRGGGRPLRREHGRRHRHPQPRSPRSNSHCDGNCQSIIIRATACLYFLFSILIHKICIAKVLIRPLQPQIPDIFYFGWLHFLGEQEIGRPLTH